MGPSDFVLVTPDANVRIDVLDADTPVDRMASGLLVPRHGGEVIRVHNLVTTAGINWVRDAMLGLETGGLTHMARGSGSTAAAIGQTALVTETERDAVTSTVSSSGQIVYQYLEPASANNGQTFREAGLFDAASTGTMFNRWVHTAIVKSSAKQILYSVTIILS